MEIFCTIKEDPAVEINWVEKTLRPERLLTHPAQAYIEGLKTVRPALHFNTFDAAKARDRRVRKQLQDQASAKQRKAALVAPTAALKAALNPKKLPPGNPATVDENRMVTRGEKNKRMNARHAEKMRAKRRQGRLTADVPETDARAHKRPRREGVRTGDKL
jgi:hypothetical protein